MFPKTDAKILLILLAVWALMPVSSPAQVATKYTIDFSDSRNRYVAVEMNTEATGDSTELMMPVWTPGSYLVREYSRNIDSLQITTTRGKSIPYRKTRKNRWTVDTQGVKKFRVSYRVYCNELSVRTNWAGREFAVLNGAATFLTVPQYRKQKHLVEIVFPKGWSKSATSLSGNPDRANSYVANDFDELVDSPIVAGNLHFYPFEVGGVPHVLVNVGEKGFWNGAQAAIDLKKMVKAHHDMWGNIPYKKYVFLNVICDSGGGLEHDNSCLMMTSRSTQRQPGRYTSWLSLASHEFFHTWNVRRLRPKALVNYDYDNENYTPSLWIAEGITSYYEDLLLVRCKLMSQSDFLSRLSGNIQSVQNRRGRRMQSLAESSFDSWIKFYRPDENSANTSISYYSKGAVAAFLLDGKVRLATDNQKSLDDVMRRLYELYSGERGYSPQQFRDVVNEVAGSDLSDWFARSIDSVEELDYSNGLDAFGLQLPGFVSATENASSKPQTSRRRADRPWIGFSVSGDGIVSRVELDSPATDAGINNDDEIIAVDGYRLTGSLSGLVAQKKVGTKLDLIISRRREIMNVELTIGNKPYASWRLRKASRASKEQKKRYRSWFDPSMSDDKKSDDKKSDDKKSDDKKSDDKKSDDKKADHKKADDKKSDDKKSDDKKTDDKKADHKKADDKKADDKKTDDKKTDDKKTDDKKTDNKKTDNKKTDNKKADDKKADKKKADKKKADKN